jgi:hypothetical protein
MNMSDVERLIRENNTTLLDSIMALTGRAGVPVPTARAADTPESEVVWLTFYWGGKFGRYVPEDFTFPSCDVPTLWNVWHHGNRQLRIQPYKKLTQNHYDDLKTRKEQSNLTKAKLLMSKLEAIGIDKGYMDATTNISTMTLRQSSALLRKCFDVFVESLYGDRRESRATEKLYTTLANRFYKKRNVAALGDHPSSDSDLDQE